MTTYQKRDEILGLDTSGDHTHLDSISLDTLHKLVREGLLDPEGTQNDSPTVREFMEFMETYPQVVANGYAIGAGRTDARISIEGLRSSGPMTLDLAIAVGDSFHKADEFQISGEGFRVCWD